MTSVDVFLAAARALRFVREEPRNSNAGQAVETFLSACGTAKGAPWCMAFVHYVGKSCFGALWTLPMNASCQQTYDVAHAKGLGVPTSDLQPGDLLFIWSAALKRLAHVAIIAAPRTANGYPTIEGNTNDGGSRDGWGVFSRVRSPSMHDAAIRPLLTLG